MANNGNDGVFGPPSPLSHIDYTIAWICALPLELTASCAMLDQRHPGLPVHNGDKNTYVLGRINQHNVVMACLPGQYGTNNAAIVATNLKRSFPSICATLMVGIGGGAPGAVDVRLGDVVVGTRVMQHDMGKDIGDSMFEITADQNTPARQLLAAVMTLRATREQDLFSNQTANLLRTRLPGHGRPSQPDRLFLASYDHPLGALTCDKCDPEKVELRRLRVPDEPKIHYGGIASGNSVIRNAKKRDDIAKRFSVLCFEMEAAGLIDSECLPIRGICDYADSHKNKDWQCYAAATAAAYARELLQTFAPRFREPSRATTIVGMTSEPSASDDQTLERLKRRQRLLEFLDFPQIDARKTTIQAAQTKTCQWFLQHPAYQDWLDSQKRSQNHGFLWIWGKAGAGKSTTMKYAYLAMKKASENPRTGVASFFFNARGDYLEKSVTGMYRSILMQLFKKFPDLQAVLDDTDIVPLSQKSCPNLNALKELLRSAILALNYNSFTCFIDALDECDEQEVRDMVRFFEDLAEATGDIQFRVCFSSRPYPYIIVRKGALFTLEEQLGHKEDLALYIKSNLRIDDLSLLEELQSQILFKATGIFLWVVLVVDILNKEEAEGGLALRKKLSEIPARLSDLFKSILLRDQHEPGRLLLCILWVLCAKRPLTPAEFRHALWVGLLGQGQGEHNHQVDSELPDVQNMNACVRLATSSSKGLVEVSKSRQPTVQFIHESVRDFLVRENGLRDLWPDLGFEWEARGHERLKLCCTTYLALAGMPKIFNGDKQKWGILTRRFAFLDYASQQVLHHANMAAVSIPQEDFLFRFFTSGMVRVIDVFGRHRIRSYWNASPLYVLADQGMEHLVRRQMMEESVASFKGGTYENPLFAALANGSEAIARLLIENGADVNAVSRYGWTVLMAASRNGYTIIARLLLQKGADVNAVSAEGWTALMVASRYRHTGTAQLLIQKGADVNVRHYNRMTH